jgi:hypothetical protein
LELVKIKIRRITMDIYQEGKFIKVPEQPAIAITPERETDRRPERNLPQHLQKVAALQAKYPSLTYQCNAFMNAYTGNYPVIYCTKTDSIVDAYLGTTPTISAVNAVFSTEVSSVIVSAWLVCLDEYVGKGALTKMQIEEIALLIIKDGYFLKLGELAMFFQDLKMGKFGQLFGNINPMWVMEQFQKFKIERKNKLTEYENNIRQADMTEKRKLWAMNAASQEEINKIMSKFSEEVQNLTKSVTYAK